MRSTPKACGGRQGGRSLATFAFAKQTPRAEKPREYRNGSAVVASKKTLDMKSPPVIGLTMFRKALSARGVIPFIMCFQVVPLLVFPSTSYTLKSQEWWLPVLLTFLVIIALIQLLIRRSPAASPWYLMSFAQGVNIISRLMMLLPHSTSATPAGQHFNGGYFIIAAAAMIVSAFEIWYNELPEVRRKLSST